MGPPNSHLVRVLKVLAVLAAVTLVLWFIASAWASNRVESARARLESVTGSTESLKVRFPHGSQNAAASKLEELVASLSIDGVQLVPKYRQGEVGPATRESDFRQGYSAWLEVQREEPSARVAAPPEALGAFLAAEGSTLDVITSLLLAEERPRWEQSAFDDGFDAPIPTSWGISR